MSYLGPRTKRGATDPDNPLGAGCWTVTFAPQDIGISVESEVFHIAVKGPAASTFDVYLDTLFYDTVSRGDKNSWDPNQPMRVRPGTTVYFYYDVSTGNAPIVTLYFREIGLGE